MADLHDELVVWQGAQYQPGAVPAGVDASTLPTLSEWFAAQRVDTAAPAATKPTRKRKGK